jgi:hypothetical protein
MPINKNKKSLTESDIDYLIERVTCDKSKIAKAKIKIITVLILMQDEIKNKGVK